MGKSLASNYLSTIAVHVRRILKRKLPLRFQNVLRSLLGRRQEFDEIELIRMTCLDQAEGTMIDVGAHTGGALLPFAALGWRIYAFEPDPMNRERLLENVGHLTNVSVDERALSDTSSDDMPFYSSEVSTGISGFHAFDPSHQMTTRVNVTTLTRFVEESGITYVDFLKTDTEGHDLFVLRGGPHLSSLARITMVEFEDRKTVPLGYNANELAEFLVESGYQVVVSEWEPIIKYGGRHRWRCFKTFPCEIDKSAWGNLIGFSKSEDFNSFSNKFIPLSS